MTLREIPKMPRMYNADDVDNEIAVIRSSLSFWKEKALGLQKELEDLKK